MKNELHIFIVEPDKDVRYVIQRALPKTGFHFFGFSTIMEALTALETASVDLLICDKESYYEADANSFNKILKLPKYGTILLQPEFAQIPPRLISELGFTAMLLKPFTVHNLRQTIENVINQNRSERSPGSKKQKWLRLAFDHSTANTPKVTTLPQGKLITTLASEDIFDLMFEEIARRQPLPEDIDAFDVVEMHLIRRALETCKGNQSKAAKFLGITRNTLRKRIKKYGFATLETDDLEEE